MSHSLLSANSQTHVKIVIVALVGAILVVLGGITAHVNASRDIARLQAHAPVVKAAKPVSYTGQSGTAVR
jgi:cytochrome oxidase Cu insertion factor (SCO1/SenC/PrrC family)